MTRAWRCIPTTSAIEIWSGATVVLPLLGREIPIVADDYVDPAFGTGAVKVTPAHDPNDFEIGERHDCAKINVMAADATITAEGGPYVGLDRYEARKKIVADLEAQGLLVKTDDHVHAVGHCYRCHTVIEPWLSDQWFVDMKPLAAPAIQAVRDERVVFHPKRWENVYFHWMENIRDWCISRQLWWGHRIPIFYCDACGEMTASMEDLTECLKCGAPVRQDEDVLDTWFSSQLWPFATMGWPEKTPELDYFYPTGVLSTARDILFLWVARMIMSGMYFNDGEIPFRDVIIHPTVFNAEGKRMSKSLGTGVDPLDLMEHYGADGMRFGSDASDHRQPGYPFRRGQTRVEPQLREQDLEREPVRAHESRRGLRAWRSHGRDGRRCLDPVTAGRSCCCRGRGAGHLPVRRGRARALYDFFWSEFCDWYIELAKPRLIAGGAGALSGQAQSRVRARPRTAAAPPDDAVRHRGDLATSSVGRRGPCGFADDRCMARFRRAVPVRRRWRGASVSALQEIVTAVRAVRARYGRVAHARWSMSIREGLSELMRCSWQSLAEQSRRLRASAFSPSIPTS